MPGLTVNGVKVSSLVRVNAGRIVKYEYGVVERISLNGYATVRTSAQNLELAKKFLSPVTAADSHLRNTLSVSAYDYLTQLNKKLAR